MISKIFIGLIFILSGLVVVIIPFLANKRPEFEEWFKEMNLFFKIISFLAYLVTGFLFIGIGIAFFVEKF